MSEEEKKKKKGMAIVIAVTPHAPKKPEDTSKPDEKMEKAWAMMKDSARYRPELDEDPRWTGTKYEQQDARNDAIDEHYDMRERFGIKEDDEPEEEEDDPMESWMEDEEKLKSWPMKKAWFILKNANILADQEEGRDFARNIAGKPTLQDYQELMSHIAQFGDEEANAELDGAPSHIPSKPSEIPVEDPMDDVREEEEREEKLSEGVDPEEYELGSLREKEPHPSKYDEEPTNPFKR